MGGRTYKAGHQRVYYCVNKERAWKRLQQSPENLKQEHTCSKVRSINIGMTDRNIWELVKSMLGTIRKIGYTPAHQPKITNLRFDDLDAMSPDAIIGMSNEQVELHSEENKRVLISTLMHRITVNFDRGSGKHHLSVEWAGWVLDLIGTSLQQEGAPENWHWSNQPAPQCQSKAGRCKLAPDKHVGKIGCSSNLDDLSRHGGVIPLGGQVYADFYVTYLLTILH